VGILWGGTKFLDAEMNLKLPRLGSKYWTLDKSHYIVQICNFHCKRMYENIIIIIIIFNYALQPFKAYCAIWGRCSNFCHQASPRNSTQWLKVELWARNVR
jgi:hypothetical protein